MLKKRVDGLFDVAVALESWTTNDGTYYSYVKLLGDIV